MEAAEQSIHNRNIKVRPHDLPWYNSRRLRSLKRQVKRKYENAKHQNFKTHAWTSFCQARIHYQEQLKIAEDEYNTTLRQDLNNPSKKKLVAHS